MAAAVSDYIPAFAQDGKLKKDVLGDKWDLSLKQNIDILSNIDKEGICVVGFKAEMDKDKATHNATKMLEEKNLDAVCLNILEDSSSFGTETNKVAFITQEDSKLIDTADKLKVSFQIIQNAQELAD
jgi:phosphopantothenoylcysteine decarboxylase/phosphopantothenate--cysteine ligase